jgi:hypothetical protein
MFTTSSSLLENQVPATILTSQPLLSLPVVTSSVSDQPSSVRYELPSLLETIVESVPWSLNELADEEVQYVDEDSFWGPNFDPATLMVDERYLPANILPQARFQVFVDEQSTSSDGIPVAQPVSALVTEESFNLGLYGIAESESCDLLAFNNSPSFANDLLMVFASTDSISTLGGKSLSMIASDLSDDIPTSDDNMVSPSDTRKKPITPITPSISTTLFRPVATAPAPQIIKTEIVKKRSKFQRSKKSVLSWLKSFCTSGTLARVNRSRK